MRIMTKGRLRRFGEEHPRGAEAWPVLDMWYSTVRQAEWKTPADVKAMYGDASILKGGRVVFNIGGNRFRLVTHVNYRRQIVYVRFVGTHREYDKIDAETI
jgi:mRNA interferase HigB